MTDTAIAPHAPVEKLRYSRREAAEKLGISERKLDYLIAEKFIAHIKNGRNVQISAKEIRRVSLMNLPARK